MGWEPANNNEHKITNSTVSGCPMSGKTEASTKNGMISYIELGK
jgi:hypothetical protein